MEVSVDLEFPLQVVENDNLNTGFDAANEAMVDMIATGIIDPAKVEIMIGYL